MTRKTLTELFTGQPGPPSIRGMVDAVLKDADGTIVQHLHQPNLITEYMRLLFVPNTDFNHHLMYLFINENTEPAHPARTSLRTTLPGTWAQNVTPSLNGPARIWTYQTVFAAPPAQRTIGTIGLTRGIASGGFTNVKGGPSSVCAMTVLSTPIVQTTAQTLEVSYRLAFQRS